MNMERREVGLAPIGDNKLRVDIKFSDGDNPDMVATMVLGALAEHCLNWSWSGVLVTSPRDPRILDALKTQLEASPLKSVVKDIVQSGQG